MTVSLGQGTDERCSIAYSHSMRSAATLLGLAAVALGASQPALSQEPLGLSALQRPFQNWGRAAFQVGKRFTFVCPASDGAQATIYGTGAYTADSAVCGAAIHAGVLPPNVAGAVTTILGAAAASFPGSTRNGVTTRSYGPWDRSFTFARDTDGGSISWTTVWSGIPEDFTTPIAVACPGTLSTDGTIWGTDVYTRDSAICVAAVHTGVIDGEAGGEFLVQRVQHAGEFAASKRHGIQSQPYRPYRDAFQVIKQSKVPSVAPGVRTIHVDGLTLQGDVATYRTIVVAPLTLTHSAESIRSIVLPGLTVVGSL